MTRIKRVLARVTLGKATREAADSTSVRGTLSQMSVVDLVQSLDIGRKTCRLGLSHQGQQGEMQFHNGQLVDATFGNLVGEAAVYVLVDLDGRGIPDRFRTGRVPSHHHPQYPVGSAGGVAPL